MIKKALQKFRERVSVKKWPFVMTIEVTFNYQGMNCRQQPLCLGLLSFQANWPLQYKLLFVAVWCLGLKKVDSP